MSLRQHPCKTMLFSVNIVNLSTLPTYQPFEPCQPYIASLPHQPVDLKLISRRSGPHELMTILKLKMLLVYEF